MKAIQAVGVELVSSETCPELAEEAEGAPTLELGNNWALAPEERFLGGY